MARLIRVAGVCCTSLMLLLAWGAAASAQPLRLLTLDNTPVDPFAEPHQPVARATVFLFVSVECPISNRYAPEVKRIHDRFASAGVSFWLVYPNPSDSPEAIREHVKAYGYPMRVLRDPDHTLVKMSGATITPEAAVFDARRTLMYRGRIDDKYVAIGLERPSPTVRDLDAALTAMASGSPIANPRTQAVGCYIADFVHIHR